MGKNYYFAGDWDTTSQETFTADDFETPFFNYNGNKWVYVGDNFSNLTISEINSQKGYPQDNGNWQIMVTDFKYLIAQAIFSSFAKLGEWVFNNKYMFSAKNAGGSSTGYQNYQGMPDNNQLTSGFIPTAAFDADTGRASLSGDKVRFNPDGSGWLANKNITWEANGKTELRDNVVIGKDVIWKDLTAALTGYIKMSTSNVGLTFWTPNNDYCAEIYITGGSGGILELRAYDGSEPLQLSHTNLTYKGNNVISWDDIKISFAKPVTGIRRRIKHAISDVNLNDSQNQDYETIIGEQSSGTTIQVTLPTTPSDGQELLFKTYSNACPINIKFADTDYGKGIKVSNINTMTSLLLPYSDWKNAKLVWNASTYNWDVFLMM